MAAGQLAERRATNAVRKLRAGPQMTQIGTAKSTTVAAAITLAAATKIGMGDGGLEPSSLRDVSALLCQLS